jgi:molybdate transport system substrate-binding protein
MFRPFSYVLLSALLTFSPWRTASAQQEPVTTFAAASLSDALNSIGKTFTNQTGVAVRFSFASSAVLAKQIDQEPPPTFSRPPMSSGWSGRRHAI